MEPNWRTSQHKKLVVKHIIAPFGPAIDQRPPIPTAEERMAERTQKRVLKLERRAERQELAAATARAEKAEKAKKEEEAEDIYKWWEAQNANRDGSVKWETLEHNGVYFPPPYEPLPSHVKMKYNGASRLLKCGTLSIRRMYLRPSCRPSTGV